MIRLEDINKNFNGKSVLKGISAEFLPGVINLIIGASGVGKSVLVKSMVGLEVPDSGKVFFNDLDFHNLDYSKKQSLRKEIGMLFQGTALFD